MARSPLPAAALLYALGLVAAQYLPEPPLLWLLLVSFSVAVPALIYSPARLPLLHLLLPLVAWTNFRTHTAIVSPHDIRALFGDSIEALTVRGRLRETPVLRLSKRRAATIERSVVEVELEAILRRERWEPAFGRVVVTSPGTLDGPLFAGQPVEISGVLAPPKGPRAPGQFDYRGYLRWRGVYYQLRCETTNDCRLWASHPAVRAFPPWPDRFCDWAQRVLSKGLSTEDESLRLLWAMVLGWKTALTQEVAEPFMQSGTLHIFAISGLHIALIAGILISLLRVLQVPRAASGVVVVPLIWFYTVATGWQASAIRSTVMMTIVVAGWALQRPGHLLNSLAASGLIILIWDPTQLYQAGFQLSFFVVLGIALIVPPLEKVRERLLRPDPLLPRELRPRIQQWLDQPTRWITTSMATSFAAWLGSLPLIATYFHMITPGSLLANLVIVPLSSLALMSSLGSLVCGDWLPFFTELFNLSAWLWMLWMARLSKWFASLPGAYFYVQQPSLAASLAYYIVLGIVLSGVLVVPRRRFWAGVTLALVLTAWLVSWGMDRRKTLLTVLPNRAATVLIDGAGERTDLLIDPGDPISAQSLVQPFLRSQGINRLPRILLSHGDLAHAGGTELISSGFPTTRIFTSSASSRSPAYRALLAKLDRLPDCRHPIHRGATVGPWQVLHPEMEDRFAQAADAAIVLRAQLYGTRILLVSDLGRLGQRQLLRRESELSADILIAGISTQDDTANQSLIDAVKPRLIIIGSGDFPASARPSPRLRERLKALRIPVLYTSDSGAVTLTFHPRGWSVKAMEGTVVRPEQIAE